MNFKIKFQKNAACNMLIFDSGLGGLSIYKKMKKNFPNANYIYACDNAAFPYGEKEEHFIIERCLKIIDLISNRINVTMVILACNTISVTSLLILKNNFNFPIIGIIPNIAEATKITKNKVIGLLATKITINNHDIQKKILSMSENFTIKTLHDEKLVRIVEKKLKYNSIKIETINSILKPWHYESSTPDTIILGCTHFNFLKKEIKRLFSKKINIVDSSPIIPKNIYNVLKTNTIKKQHVAFFSKPITHHIPLSCLFNKYDFLKFKTLRI
ncbi:MAG: glutamate racemase [Buchnera aphidicola (Meitanaphis microgallis)]